MLQINNTVNVEPPVVYDVVGVSALTSDAPLMLQLEPPL